MGAVKQKLRMRVFSCDHFEEENLDDIRLHNYYEVS